MSPNVVIVILAAGGSKRLGSPKQLLQFRGTTLIRYLVKTAMDSRANKVAVVLGDAFDQIRSELGTLQISVIRNEQWPSGIGSSIRRAVEVLRDNCDALLFMTSDQPLVTTPVLNSFIEQFRSAPGKIVASEYSETLGVPALFPKEYFDELSKLPDTSGAKSVLLKHQSSVVRIAFPDGAIDIDQLSDLHKLQ